MPRQTEIKDMAPDIPWAFV